MGLLAESAGRLSPVSPGRCRRLPPIGKGIVLVSLGAAASFGYPLLVWLDPLAMFSGAVRLGPCVGRRGGLGLGRRRGGRSRALRRIAGRVVPPTLPVGGHARPAGRAGRECQGRVRRRVPRRTRVPASRSRGARCWRWPRQRSAPGRERAWDGRRVAVKASVGRRCCVRPARRPPGSSHSFVFVAATAPGCVRRESFIPIANRRRSPAGWRRWWCSRGTTAARTAGPAWRPARPARLRPTRPRRNAARRSVWLGWSWSGVFWRWTANVARRAWRSAPTKRSVCADGRGKTTGGIRSSRPTSVRAAGRAWSPAIRWTPSRFCRLGRADRIAGGTTGRYSSPASRRTRMGDSRPSRTTVRTTSSPGCLLSIYVRNSSPSTIFCPSIATIRSAAERSRVLYS